MRFFKRAQQLQATLETPNSSTVELPMPENDMHQLSQEVSNLRANLGRARAHFNTLRGALSQKDKSLHEMLHQLEIQRSEELRVHSQAIDSLQAELEAARRGEREAEERSVHDANAASSELAEFTIRTERFQEQLRQDHEETLNLARMELAEYRASHTHADSEYDSHVVHIAVLQKELKERDELLQRSEADLVVAQEVAQERGTEAERLGAEAAELSATVRDLYANQEAQQTEVDTLRHEALELQQRLQETNTCFEETANSLEQQHQLAELSQAELVALQARLGEHKVECERMLQNEKCRAQEELDNTRGKMEFIKAELGVSRAEEAATAQEVLIENNKQLGSLQAGILGYQRMVAELHAALGPSHENLQSLHAQLQDLQVLYQQSEAKLIDRNWQLESLQAEIQWYERVVVELHAELAPYRDNRQSAHSEQQHLQSEVELPTVEEEDISGCSLEPSVQEAS
ncbi:spindle assembly abnormal protein 6 homolog isoform X2 [Lethenteron reissneri]|uniref:spindle assembly abnormal protein 6 homolog isoform X2 n=1 Tax=Lethenteron reissneri TaxID=7753 RepID=UPI002AB75C82|nr:spindle assembly abnormal protein 6 homolog isoform X2 [Lethenteron reissneri]XP_061436722.1 spindle assembly abnormal protein 6 homolog isoform X2 [Lethenteron reissneri]